MSTRWPPKDNFASTLTIVAPTHSAGAVVDVEVGAVVGDGDVLVGCVVVGLSPGAGRGDGFGPGATDVVDDPEPGPPTEVGAGPAAQQFGSAGFVEPSAVEPPVVDPPVPPSPDPDAPVLVVRAASAGTVVPLDPG